MLRNFLFTIVVVVATAVQGFATSTYTFEGLTPGLIYGQDGWTKRTDGSGNPLGADVSVATGPGVNSTKVAEGAFPIPLASAWAYRINDGSFSFGSLSGNETNLVWQADFRLGTSAIRTSHFAIANDGADADPFPGNAGDEAIANIGLSGPGSFVGAVDSFSLLPYSGPRYDAPISSSGPGGSSAGSITDWFRIRMEADLTANGGQGSGSLSYMNLTAGETSFTPVASIQNVNLQLLASGADPTLWDSLYVRTHEGSQMDNLIVVIPEPSTFALSFLGLLSLGHVGWRRRQT